MLKNSFIFLDKISNKTENNIWKQDIKDWDTFIKVNKIKGISNNKKLYYNLILRKASLALRKNDSSFFNLFPSTETWRLYDYFRSESVFLDIEATNVNDKGEITVIGLFDGINTKTMIKGVNLDLKELKNELSKYKLIVTFNGSSFDLPFIKKRYDLLPCIPHIDLRHLCANLGYTGGLKKIEKEFGVKRNKIVDNLHGGDPLTLWKMYKGSGDEYYLQILVEYNEEDVINLKKIMDYCYKEKVNQFLTSN